MFTTNDLVFIYHMLKGSVESFDKAKKVMRFNEREVKVIDCSVRECERLCRVIEDSVSTSILEGNSAGGEML